MKKVLLMVALGVAVSARADLVEWSNPSDFVYQQVGGSTLVPDGTSFLLTLWEDGANNIMEDYGVGDDFQVAGLTTDFIGGQFYLSFDPVAAGLADGETVYTRVFNAASIGSATWYVDVDASGSVVLDSTPPAVSWQYDPGGTATDGSDWQQIPEPTTLALLGIGLAGVAARRSRRK